MTQANTTTQYFLADALGSVRQVTDPSGAVTLMKAYDPYGVSNLNDGTAQTAYGFTGEYTDPTGNLYLRARHYSPGTGRFMTRDTWSGDINQPLSLNRWNYVQANPINLSDPTGMHPGVDHYRYCEPLGGQDRMYCNRIVRDFDPANEAIGDLQFKMYDLDLCPPNDPLHESLPHTPLGDDYGWWFHYLLDEATGSWKGKEEHIYFSDVIGISLGKELTGLKDGKAGLLFAQAFANKGWSEGFYNMLGGRQGPATMVRQAVYGPLEKGRYRICGKTNVEPTCVPFDQVSSEFSVAVEAINLWLNDGTNVMELGHRVLWDSSLVQIGNPDAPYEWGNPLANVTSAHPELWAALKRHPREDSDAATHVLYHNVQVDDLWKPTVDDGKYYAVLFIVSSNQITELCGGGSCIQ